MPSVSLQKRPARKDTVERDGIRHYIRNYGLFLTRFKSVVEDGGSTLPEKDFKLYISKLIDPLAFEAGETETVKRIEKELDSIFDENTDWDGGPFTIKTVVKKAGSQGWFIFKGKNAQIVTLAGVGGRASSVNGGSATFPVTENTNPRTRVKLENLKAEFDEIYMNPKDGDILSIRFEPSDDGNFTVSFEFSRDN
jgi:hypothetical protein